MKKLATILFLTCGSASASELPYPPYEFSLFRVWGSIALDVVDHCDGLVMDDKEYVAMNEEQMQLIEAEGFSRDTWRTEMRDIPVGVVDQVRDEFYFAYGIRRNSSDDHWCASARHAMGRQKYLDRFLKEKRG